MRKILIVERNPELAIWLAEAVQTRLGLSPIIACNAELALDVLVNFNYELVISDCLSQYPHSSTEKGQNNWRWLDLLHARLRTLSSDVPLLAMSSYPAEWFCNYTAHGLSGFIAKPFDLSKTLRQIKLAVLGSEKRFEEAYHSQAA